MELQQGPARTLVAALGAVLLSLTLLAARADAAPTWLPAQALAAPATGEPLPQVAAGADGNAVAVWERLVGGSTVIETSVHTAAGWSAPTQLSSAVGNANDPQVVIDASGTATAIWDHSNGTRQVIEIATHPAGGSWSAAGAISDGTRGAFRPQLSVDRSGDLVAAWETRDGVNAGVEAATRSVAGGWTGATTLSPGGHLTSQPQVAIDPGGNAVVTWRVLDENSFVEVANHPAGGAWSSATRLTLARENGFDPQVAIGPGGFATVVWTNEGGEAELIKAASQAPGGPWSTPSAISLPGENAGGGQSALEAQVSPDPSGGVIAVWARKDGTHFLIEAATQPEGGAWSAASVISNPGLDGFDPQVVVDPRGNVTATWVGASSALPELDAVTHPVGGAWSPPIRVSSPARGAFESQLAVSPEGDAVAVWEGIENRELFGVETATLDVAPPKLQSTSFPATGRVGASLSFAATASDGWSSLGAASWRFGDGASGSGLTATHIFAKPGVRQVTLTVSDAVGNATTRSQTVTIAPRANVRAIAASLVKVVKGKALLKLSCPAAGPCRGTAKIGLKQTVKHGKKRAKKVVTIAHGRVNLRPGAHATVKLKLAGKAKHLLAAAGKHGLRATLSGSAVKRRVVRLVASGKKRRKQRG